MTVENEYAVVNIKTREHKMVT